MRRWKLIAALSGASVGALLACGPSSDEICDFSGTCESPLADASDTGIPDQTTDVDAYVPPDSSDGGGDEDVHVPPDAGPCDLVKEPYDGCQPNDQSGIFVNAAANPPDSGALGTMQSPYKRISDAIAALSSGEPTKPGRIYVCQGEYAETVTIDNKVAEDLKIFGGLNCATWAWVSNATVHVKSAANAYALRIDGASSKVDISDVNFEAPTASGVDGTGAGDSSIAVFASGASVDVAFHRGSLRAGAGVAGGLTGTPPPDYTTGAAAGNPGLINMGGAAQGVTCSNASGATTGGGGGNPNSGGQPGGPNLSPAPQPSYDGHGGTGGGCTSGGPGAYGPGGKNVGSAGAGASSVGTLDASGWHPGNGSPGAVGITAQGGGGGGGAGGGGGGSGGAGGCGGSGGLAGAGGGASIALLSYKATVKLLNVSVFASGGVTGGTGGKGQNGQSGGTQGLGYNNGLDGCNGGRGGVGGSGGGGGGGAGGISVGIGYVGQPPSIDGTAVPDAPTHTGFTIPSMGGGGGGPGQPGAAGDGGSGNPAGFVGDQGTKGADGVAAAVRALPGS